MSIVVLKRTSDNNVDLVDLKDFAIERQVELELMLEPGSYIILPRTTGCTLRRPTEALDENVDLVDSKGEFNEMLESTISDIF